MPKRKVENFGCFFSNLPTECKEMLCCFIECKRFTYISEVSNVTFAQQPMWVILCSNMRENHHFFQKLSNE